MEYGYVRTSTSSQSPNLQLDALRERGVRTVFKDLAVSGYAPERKGLAALLATVTSGDAIVVWKLDRLVRSQAHFIELLAGLHANGVVVVSITEGIDTRTPGGQAFAQFAAMTAQLERELIRERTTAGLAAAKARGARIGRPVAVTSEQLAQARTLVEAGHGVGDVARTLSVGRSTLYRALKEAS